jgi:hypothetical protein
MALSDNLIHYWKLDGNSNDAVGSTNGSDTGITYSSGNGKIVQGAGFARGSSSKISFGTGSDLQLQAPFSIQLWYKPGNGSSVVANVMVSGNNTGGNGIQLVNYNGAFGVNGMTFYEYYSGSFHGIDTDGLLTDGTWYHVVVTDDGTTVKQYINGSVQSATMASGTIDYTSFVGFLLGRTGSGADGLTGAIDEVGVWTRALSGSEVTQLYNGGAGSAYPYVNAYTLTAATGSYTLTGQAANLLKGFRLAAGTGTFTLTGIAATLRRGFGIVAETGTFILTGNPASLLAARKLVAEAGSFTLTGVAATFARGYRIIAQTGVFSLVGKSVRLLLNGSVQVYANLFTKQNTEYSDKLSSQSNSYTNKYPL